MVTLIKLLLFIFNRKNHVDYVGDIYFKENLYLSVLRYFIDKFKESITIHIKDSNKKRIDYNYFYFNDDNITTCYRRSYRCCSK